MAGLISHAVRIPSSCVRCLTIDQTISVTAISRIILQPGKSRRGGYFRSGRYSANIPYRNRERIDPNLTMPSFRRPSGPRIVALVSPYLSPCININYSFKQDLVSANSRFLLALLEYALESHDRAPRVADCDHRQPFIYNQVLYGQYRSNRHTVPT
ncbi:hypothetical protein EI94DRAFT_1189548 [Lactarius quietus]|nr:hypothetical protein EI94DRAFT_1189548 [Lactarius quietus]